MMKYFLSVCAGILFFAGAHAQVQNVVIDQNYPGHFDLSEPCIAVDPRNPNNVVAGSNTKNVYRSTDGGMTWSRGTLSSSYGVFGDPVILADTSGSFYYFHLSNNSAITVWPQWCDRIVCQRLDDVATGSWTDGGYAGLDTPTMQDKPWVAVDPQTNTMYMTWTRFDHYGTTNPIDSSNILFSKSTDKGETWSAPLRINTDAGDCVDDDFTVEGAVPCVGKHGEVFVAWDVENAILFDRSYDGGSTWETHDIHVADMPGGWAYDIPGLNRCDGLSYLACDLSSSPYAGTLYISWSDQRNGPDNTDVWICKSTDNGSTWSAPMRVNDDAGTTHQFMSSMTVDPYTGYIYVLFYDRRNYTDSLSTDVYMALSKDGGGSFKNFKISDTAFRPRADFFFGDYTYISAFNNVVRPVWGHLNVITSSNYKQQIKTAIIPDSLINPVGITALQPMQADMQLKVYPNPTSELATISYTLPATADVRLTVTDAIGREVAELQQGQQQSGRHTATFDARTHNLPAGMYVVTLKTAGSRQSVKLVVSK